ncbi:MAG: DUF1573 domain-containing protein [Saprospiraceae bacterium]|nr:DUF1573 domain-containing protein [Candidatus Opimibacter skivensis]MBP6680828.1 DUF1573 domain-containing protein [Saprospiraceae bacterium]MBP8086230.1 DUF1573 domain-containing protein [Saprospiraceae bacterium]
MVRITILISGLVLVLTSGCKETSSGSTSSPEDTFKPGVGMADLVYNPVRSDGTIDSSYLPILTWESEVYDFGTIFEGDVVTKDYSFTNTGTAPLLILSASSTCGCTIPEWPKTPIAPDSTSSIKVKFNSLHKAGDQSKEVTIFANTFPNSSKITIKGKVDLKK